MDLFERLIVVDLPSEFPEDHPTKGLIFQDGLMLTLVLMLTMLVLIALLELARTGRESMISMKTGKVQRMRRRKLDQNYLGEEMLAGD